MRHPHPVQPVVKIEGIFRFKENKVVQYLLEEGGLDLSDVVTFAERSRATADLAQFLQLIGSSVDAASTYPCMRAIVRRIDAANADS